MVFLGGQFKSATHGQFKSAQGGQFDRILQQHNYLQIKQDVQDIIQSEMERLLNDPGQAHLVVRKG